MNITDQLSRIQIIPSFSANSLYTNPLAKDYGNQRWQAKFHQSPAYCTLYANTETGYRNNKQWNESFSMST